MFLKICIIVCSPSGVDKRLAGQLLLPRAALGEVNQIIAWSASPKIFAAYFSAISLCTKNADSSCAASLSSPRSITSVCFVSSLFFLLIFLYY